VSLRSAVALPLAAALLAGCASLAPAYDRPQAPIPTAFPQGGPYAAADGVQPINANIGWRSAFLDPKLRGLIETALAENRDLRATVANVAAVRAQFEVQRSQLLPTIAAGVSSSNGRSVFAGNVVRAKSAQAQLGIASYELDLFGRLRSLSTAAFERYLATDEGRRSAAASLVAEVADAYLTLAANRSLLAVSRDTEQAGEQSLMLIRSRFEGGVASQLEVSQAETVVEQARANSASYATAAAQAKNALDLLVGVSVPEAQTPASLAETEASFVEIPAGVSSAILLNRPDVLAAEHQLIAANANIGAARAAFFPSITLTAQAGVASSDLAGLFKDAGGIWSFAPAVSLPIFTGGRNRANLRASEAQADGAVAAYEGAIQAAFRDVADALAARGGTAATLESQRRLVAASEEALKLSAARYERGADSYLVQLDAQRTLYAARLGLAQAELARTSSLVAVYRALGGSIPAAP
jgi:multidrug efflux system outer membrane protein